MSWQYKREERQQFPTLAEGQYRIRIKSADKAQSKSGNDMLALQFEVSGSSVVIYHYIVFLDDKPEITNRMLTQFFDSFKDIPEGDFNMQNWIGKVGAAKIKNEEYNGNVSSKISYFISKDKQAELPEWREADGKPAPQVDENGFMQADDDDKLPF